MSSRDDILEVISSYNQNMEKLISLLEAQGSSSYELHPTSTESALPQNISLPTLRSLDSINIPRPPPLPPRPERLDKLVDTIRRSQSMDKITTEPVVNKSINPPVWINDIRSFSMDNLKPAKPIKRSINPHDQMLSEAMKKSKHFKEIREKKESEKEHQITAVLRDVVRVHSDSDSELDEDELILRMVS